MDNSWQAGDLALCVGAHVLVGVMSGMRQSGLAKGRIYLVRGVKQFDLFSATGLKIDGFVGWIRSDHFRKIRPHTPDAEDIETIELLTGKPVEIEIAGEAA